METKARTTPAQIAELISSVNTDDRGLILQQVAAYLRADAQGFTAYVFDQAARIYNAGGTEGA